MQTLWQTRRYTVPLLTVLAALLGILPARAANTWALLVGISKYQNPQISSLRFPAGDATGIRDALVSPQLGGLPSSNVRLLVDDQATAASILSAVDSFLAPNVKPGDHVILFLAGHGVAKGVGTESKSFLLPTDVKGVTTSALDASAINLKVLSDRLSKLPAAQFVIFMDACREDPTPGRGIKGNLASDILYRGIQVPGASATFFACSIGQRAFEDPNLKHGVFTYWILDAIEKAAVPQKPDGAVDMGRLASYVTDRVRTWAKDTSAKGDFEIEQTPDFTAQNLEDQGIVLMRVKRPLPDTPITPTRPEVRIIAPDGAQVSINGEKAGAAPLQKTLPRGGEYTIRVEAPGYETVERKVRALDGYDIPVVVEMPPGGRGTGASAESRAADLFKRAQEAESRQQWDAARSGYQAVIGADATFAPAYERLAALQARGGDLKSSVTTLADMVAKTPSTAHGLALLSEAYSTFALRDVSERKDGKKEDKPRRNNPLGGLGGLFGGRRNDKKDDAKTTSDEATGPYAAPANATQAAQFALRAANEAVKQDANSAEAQAALGFALAATDDNGKNKQDALKAFGQAVQLAPEDPASHYGLGFGIRYFAQTVKDESDRNRELQRAVASLNEAVRLRPDYFEAHLELAYCYHQMGNTQEAKREYQLANAYRGTASDRDEVAGANCALAGIHSQEAQGASGEKKQGYQAASAGYMDDAHEIQPDLTRAVRLLGKAGLRTRLQDYLPPELRSGLDIGARVRGLLPPGVGGVIPIPNFPRFP